MTLCIPFLMFQGQAQEAIDHYLTVFPDAELLEIVHHPEGTEIYDPSPPSAAEPESEDAAAEVAEDSQTLDESGPLDTGDLPEDLIVEDSEDDGAEVPDADPTSTETATPGTEEDEPTSAESSDSETSPLESSDAHSMDPESTDTTLITVTRSEEEDDGDEVIDVPTPLVATAQLKIGGQVLMIQDSLMKHAFSFTPSISVAVVVDSTAEFNQIVDSLAPGGEFLMEPGDYDFAANFAWIKDRFGMSWQVNQPLAQPEPTATAEAPVWG